MGKTATVFKDIGKACNDLLTKDYKVGKNTVEVKSKTPSGVTITPSATKSGDAVSGSLAAKYLFAPGIEGEATFGTSGSIALSVEAAEMVKGLTLTAECDRQAPNKPGLLASGNLIADYKTELFACKSSYDYYKKSLLASASTVYAAFAMGIDCSYDTGKGKLQKYAAACQYVQPEFTVSAKCEDKGGSKTLGCGYYHKVSPDMQLAVALSKPLAKDVAIQFGCAYKLDKDTTCKGKVDSDGILSCSYKQKISPLTTMTLAATIDTVQLSDNSKHKFGLQLNITP